MKGIVGAIVSGVLLFGGVVTCALCLERIPAGYVGVVYSMNGGVQDEILTQGFHFVAPTKTVKEFTVSNEQLILSEDERDGSEGDDSFLVSTADNANIRVSFQMSYRYKQDQVVQTYKKFKGMDGDDIVASRVRTILKAKVSEVTTDYTMMDIYSGIVRRLSLALDLGGVRSQAVPSCMSVMERKSGSRMSMKLYTGLAEKLSWT